VRSLAEPWAKAFARRRGQYTRRWEALVAERFPDLPPETVSATSQACLAMVFSVAGWPDRALAVADIDELLMGLISQGLDALS
jgi:hypothetical protein